MPFIEESSYKSPSVLLKNQHISTIYASKILHSKSPDYTRKRLELPDGDFLDLDYKRMNSQKAVILCHGLEGSSVSNYNNRSANFFLENGYAVFAWNNRSCSGKMNRLPKLYHHGEIGDLGFVIEYVSQLNYEQIYLMGFSMGAAQIMNYLGRGAVHPKIKAAVAVSCPISLKSSAEILKVGFNRVYLKNFTLKISKKLKLKAAQFPDFMDWNWIDDIRSFDEIDDNYTAPVNGFANGNDYYHKASPAFVMEKIQIPVLVLNAQNDPFLGEECYPVEFAKNHPSVFLEIPKTGGHCAFLLRNSAYAYAELKAYEFFNSRMVSNGL